MDELLELAGIIIARRKTKPAPESEPPRHVEVTSDGNGTVDRVRIGQEGRWLVLRPINPLADITMTYCQFFNIDYPETGEDQDGPYVRWPLDDVTLQR